jgi:hypothetical protein
MFLTASFLLRLRLSWATVIISTRQGTIMNHPKLLQKKQNPSKYFSDWAQTWATAGIIWNRRWMRWRRKLRCKLYLPYMIQSRWVTPCSRVFSIWSVKQTTSHDVPPELLNFVKGIEKKMGREPGPVNSPRPVDIDILFYGNQVIAEPALTNSSFHVWRKGLSCWFP